MKRAIDSLKIYCPNRSKGCDKITTLGECNKHLEKCLFVEVSCIHALKNVEKECYEKSFKITRTTSAQTVEYNVSNVLLHTIGNAQRTRSH